MRIITIILLLLFISCSNNNNKASIQKSPQLANTEVADVDYKLFVPSTKPAAVLILFGGFPQDAASIQREFAIVDPATERDVAVLLLTYNQKLWLETAEKESLANRLEEILTANQLPMDKVHIGGFSSGGNVALLISDFLTGSANSKLAPQGVFIVDSPVDLTALYTVSEINIARNFSAGSVQESTMLIELFGEKLGDPRTNAAAYGTASVFTSSTANINSVEHLKNTKIRLYTEPDTVWWKEQRGAEADQLNAHFIEQFSQALTAANFTRVQYITTEGRGYRANGLRHPHSWSIVDAAELVEWVLGE